MKLITCKRCQNMDIVFSPRQDVCDFCKEERRRNRHSKTKKVTKDRDGQIALLRKWGIIKSKPCERIDGSMVNEEGSHVYGRCKSEENNDR